MCTLSEEVRTDVLCGRICDLEAENAKLRDTTYAWRTVDRLSCENAKLRELCRRFSEYVSHDRCEGCVCKSRCDDGEIEECWQRTEIREIARELGIEVDE